MQLQKNISNFGLLSAAICGMIGSGWLFGGMIAAKAAGPAAIISWILGGIIVAVIAVTFAELATMLPVTGGVVRYIHFSHGTVASFSISWLTWLSCVAVAPTEVSAALRYCNNIWPILFQSNGNGESLTTTGTLAAIALLFIITLLNMTAVRTTNSILTKIGSWKILVPIITAICLLITKFNSNNFTTMSFAPYGTQGILTAVSSIVIFSFLGFVEAISLAGEAKEPQKAVPITIIGSISITVLIYTILQIAFVGSINPHIIADGWHSITFPGEYGPFAGIATTLGLGALANLIYADAVISPLGTGFAFTATTARLNYGMSINKYTPQAMLNLNKAGIPRNAILFNFIVGIIILINFHNWEDLIKFQSAAIILAYATGPIALIALRKQAPDKDRPFKLSWHKSACFFGLYFVNLILYWTGWSSIYKLMLGLLVGLGIFFSYRALGTKDFSDIKPTWWLIFYCLGLSIISYIGSFEGIGILTLGYDFLVIAIFSAVVLKLSYDGKISPEKTQAILQKET